MLPRRKGAQKFTQVVPSLRGLRTHAIPAGVTALLIRTGKAIYGRILCHLIQLKNCVIGKCYTSSPYTRRLLEKEKRFFCVRCFSKKLSLSCGRKGLDETPQCEARGGSLAARGKRSVYGLQLPK